MEKIIEENNIKHLKSFDNYWNVKLKWICREIGCFEKAKYNMKDQYDVYCSDHFSLKEKEY